MAKKEALKDLQSRLADRLQTARTEGASAAWLAVKVGQRNVLLPLTQSGEIFPLVMTASVPYAQAWFKGVANLRGGLCGVVDLAVFLQDDQVGQRTEQNWAQARLVTLNPELDLNCALVIDALVGLRRQDAFVRVEAAPIGSPAFFGQLLSDTQGVTWQEINLRALAQSPEFLSIGA